ncbi:MAG: cyclic nucleotide-binding domain-containing protein [Pseudomonadota bacterium]|nr:cyclic nucleotide-binding domain-containing protein [Pseudomonadota bacterium]
MNTRWPEADKANTPFSLALTLLVVRLFQIRRVLASIHAAPGGEVDVRSLISYMKPERHAQGTVLFRKGSSGENAYYIAEGKVEFPELGISASPEGIFGEIGVFSPQRVRTASAVCASDAELYRIDIPLGWHSTKIRYSPSP